MSPIRIVVTEPAQKDIDSIVRGSWDHFGQEAALRYGALIRQALSDLRDNPTRVGAQERTDLGAGTWIYHLTRSRAAVGTRVKNPRHFIVYRTSPSSLDVLRILYDSRELRKHVPR